MQPRVSIIVLNYNGLSDTLACLDSLFKCDYPNFEVIVLDNGSGGGDSGQNPHETILHDVEVLRAYKHDNYRFIDNGKNLGFAGGCNAGMRIVFEEAKSKYIYLLNNDTEVEHDFLNKAVTFAETRDDIGIVASKSMYFDNRNIIENAGHIMLNSGDAYSRGRGKSADKYEKKEELLSACAAGILLRCSMLAKTGLFDEDFFLIYEDVDLTFRAVIMGWKCVYLPESVMYHKVSATIVKARNYEMTLRAQLNQFRAYAYNIPLGVLILNLPWIILRFLMVIVGGAIFMQWRMVRIFLHAHCLLIKQLPKVLEKRKFVMDHRKVSSWYIFKNQKNFIPYSFKYFWDIVIARKRKSIFET